MWAPPTCSPCRTGFPLSSLDRSIDPEPDEGQDRRSVGGRKQVRLLAARLIRPLEKSARGNDATPALEGVAEHRLFGDRLGARVEGGRHLLQALFPEVRHQAPAHRD